MAPSWYPSCKVKLRLVLEEFGAKPFKTPPKKPNTKLKGVDDKNDTLKAIEDPEAPPGTTRFLLVPKDADITSRGDPALHKKDSKGLTHEIAGIIPSELEWKQNGIRKADTCKFKTKWIDFPVDPRCVRACAVEAYLGTVSADDYQRGINGESRIPGQPFNVIPDDYTDVRGRYRTNLRFQGWIDKLELEWSDNEPVISFECRDNTQLLIKQEAPSKLVASAITEDIPIDEAVAQYLKHFPQMEGLTVEYRPSNTPVEDIPRLANVLGHTAFVPKLGPQQNKGGGSTEKMSVWDYLTDVCGALGHLIRVEGTSIIIQRGSSLMRSKVTPREDDPYDGRTVGGASYPIRTMIYGRNLSKLKMAREFSKKEPSNIEMRVYDPHNKTVIVVRSPSDLGAREASAKVQAVQPGDKAENKWTVVRGPAGVRDKKMLQTICDEYYELANRGELTAMLETREMSSFGGDNADPDLLDVKATDVIEIAINRDASYSTLTNIEKAFRAQDLNAFVLKRMGFSPEFAAAYAKCYSDSGFQRAFKVRDMAAKWSIVEGVTLTMTCVNFVEVRLEEKPPADPTPDAPDGAPPAVAPPKPAAPGGVTVKPNTALNNILEQYASEQGLPAIAGLPDLPKGS